MKKKALWIFLDALFVVIGLLIAIAFYFSLRVSPVRVTQMLRIMPILLCTTLLGLWLSGIYRSILKYAGSDTFFQALVATLAGTGLTYLIGLIVSLFCHAYEDEIGMRILLMPRPVYFIQWVITLALVAGSRFMIRYRETGIGHRRNGKEKRILVIGAGYAGATVIRDIQNGRYGDSRAVALIDDRAAGKRAERRVEDRAVLGLVDVLAAEHRLDLLLEAALARDRVEVGHRPVVDEVLGEVERPAGGLDRHLAGAVGVRGEGGAEGEGFGGFDVLLNGGPGGGFGEVHVGWRGGVENGRGVYHTPRPLAKPRPRARHRAPEGPEVGALVPA